ncbi:MAG: GH32 C-terminal domain-containing protein [Limisphaerales bacterium]
MASLLVAGAVGAAESGTDGSSPPVVEVFALADGFSTGRNEAHTTWTFQVGNPEKGASGLRFLAVSGRDANQLWGSDFAAPPRMWADADGYWGIGRNDSDVPQVSTRNDTTWRPGEVLLHPRGGEAPTDLVIGWTAPRGLALDLRYAFGLAAQGSDGVGLRVLRWTTAGPEQLVTLPNIGLGITHQLRGLGVQKGDRLLFCIDKAGDPGGDIVRADIRITARTMAPAVAPGVEPTEAEVTLGSDLTLVATGPARRGVQWMKGGIPIPGATGRALRLERCSPADAGNYSVSIEGVPSGTVALRLTPKTALPERFPSPVPRRVFAETLAAQEAELETDPLMHRFAESRQRLAGDRFRPTYHFVSPESQMNDPNGLCFWQGRWHLFYQAYPPDEFPDPKDIPKRRQHWGHAVSEDLVHWRDLPYAIHPGIERMCFSGSTLVESNRVIAYYPGIGAGQMVAIAKDPLLLNWDKLGGRPVKGPSGDSCLWREGDTYYGLVGDGLVASRDLVDWSSQGRLIEANPFPLGDASACPNFVPIGSKHLFLSFSHTFGGQYLLGDYNPGTHRFRPVAQGRFNHGRVSPGGVHAPSAAADGQGGVINLLNINDGRHDDAWDQILSLPQHLTLGSDGQVRIAPVAALASLRQRPQTVLGKRLPANREVVLKGIRGNAMELAVEIDPMESRTVQLNVLRSAHAEEQTTITYFNFGRKLSIWYDTPAAVSLDASRSSTLPDVWLRPPEQTEVGRRADDPAGGPLRLRVFIDRSVVEVFVNERHYLALRVYPGRGDSLGVSLRAQGQDALLKRLDAWQMAPIWPTR